MKNLSRIIVVIVLLSLGLVACKVQKAPGAYAPAKNKISKEKFQPVAADSVDVVPEPDRVVRIMGGSEAVDSMARNVAAVEPSPLVEADPEPVVEIVEEITDTTVNNPDTVVAEVVLTQKPVEQEVTRSEKFRVVEGQGDVQLKKYHVVIGSFGKRDNALNLQSQMKPDYEPILVVNERGMFRVLLVSYDTYQEAKAKIVEIQDQFPDAWCLVQQK